MRFFYAVITLAIAVALLLSSFVVRNFFSSPDTLTQSITVEGTAPVTVIDASDLRRVSGSETFVVSSTATGSAESPITVAWGRTEDVMAWIGSASYQTISVKKKTGVLSENAVTGIEPFVPDPRGSDLWVEEWSGDAIVSADLALRKGNSVIILSDGTNAAPASITVMWNLEVDRTVPTVLLYLGAAIGIIGLAMLAFALWRERRQKRHRQGRMPKAPKPPRWRPKRGPLFGLGQRNRRPGRRIAGFIAGLVAIPVVLSGCSVGGTPTQTPTPVATADAPFVAVTDQQFDRILDAVVATLKTADKKNAENLAGARMQGAALRFRAATYRVKASKPKLGTLFEIPNGTVSLLLPQQTESWPRSVFAIVDDTTSEDVPSVALVLTQDGPRSNYHVDYTFALEPGVVMPDVPASEYGTAVLPGDTELLSSTPMQVAQQYGDVLLNGDASAYVSLFTTDTLQEQIGEAAKAARVADMKGKAKFSWTESMADDVPAVFATSDAGALVALTVTESETVKPAVAGSAISTEGAVRVLSGRPSSLRGITANYQYQLLFYVPPIGSVDQIRLLGYSYALVSAQEAR